MEKAIVTVVGKDNVGIIAAVSQLLADRGINILDVSQTLMDDNFVMAMMVSVPEATDLTVVDHELAQLGQQMNLEINLRNEKLFDAMHEING